MRNSSSRPVALMFVLALLLPATALAQATDTAELTGVVLDASGRPAAGYPMHLVTPQWGQVVMKPTEADGTFGATGLPPGSYELRVFEPGGSTENPIASKQVTLAAGQKEQIEIRVAAGNPGGAGASKSAAGHPIAGTTLGTIGVNSRTVLIAVILLAAGLVVFFALRAQRRPAD